MLDYIRGVYQTLDEIVMKEHDFEFIYDKLNSILELVSFIVLPVGTQQHL